MLATFREHVRNLDSKGRWIACTSLFFTVLIYLCRAQSDEFWLMGYAAAFICIFSSPVALGLLIWLVAHLISVIRYSCRAPRSRLAVIVPTLIMVLAFFLPVPPLQEHTLFVSHQKEYETLVQLALSGQLSHDDDCRADTAYAPPKGYEHLTGDCIFMDNQGVVEFTPFTFYVTLSYFEMADDATNSSWCNWDGFVWDKIDSHWYVCKRDFN